MIHYLYKRYFKPNDISYFISRSCHEMSCLLANFNMKNTFLDRKLHDALITENVRIIEQCVVNLDRFNLYGIREAAIYSFRILSDYFLSIQNKKNAPRMSLRTISFDEEKAKTTSIFHTSPSSKAFEDRISIEDDLSLLTAFQSARPYFNNDIPSSAKKFKYYNSSLQKDRLFSYKPSYCSEISNKIDKSWTACWMNSKGEAYNEEDCFKSTIVSPLVLDGLFYRNTELLSDYQELFGVKDRNNIICGFICLDAPYTHYFSETDIDIVNIIAQFLVHFFITYHSYTRISKNYIDAKAITPIKNDHSS